MAVGDASETKSPIQVTGDGHLGIGHSGIGSQPSAAGPRRQLPPPEIS